MRFAEPFWQWWQRMMAETTPPPPRGTPEPSAWELSEEFLRTTRRLDRLRHAHRRPRHQRRRR
jgi:hypothetical protein